MNILLSVVVDKDEVTHALYDREMFEYTGAVLGYLSGLALTIILIIVPLMMAIDVVYLVVPAAKVLYDNFVERHKDLKGKIVSKLLVSKNAIEAFEDSATTGQPVMWCYMKRSIKFYLVVVAVVFILTAGLDVILMFTYKLINGVIEWFVNF